MVQKQEEQYNRDMPRFIRVPQGFMPGERATFHTCEALCQEEATFHMCAKALCQEKEYEPRMRLYARKKPRFICVRLYARRKSHVSYVCQGFMPGGRRRATYLMCAKALCQEKEYEPRILRAPRLMPAIQSKKKKKRKKKKSHISYVCEGYMPGRGRRRRRFTKSCLSYVNRGRVVKNTRVATHMFAVC